MAVASYVMELKGTVRVSLPSGIAPVSGDFSYRADLLETMGLKNKLDTVVSLDADPAESVSLGDLATGVHVVLVRVLTSGAGKVLLVLTHADGTDQTIPVDPFLFLITSASPITAMTLQRSQGIPTVVQVFVGEKFV